MKTILITGGAGFVGSNLAIKLKTRYSGNARIICLDNLKRRGSELNLSRFKENGIDFVHGDIRIREDLESVGNVDLILECSAEPSVIAGYGESPAYLVQTNLSGTINCLDFARIQEAGFIFLSTSRVYPIKAINKLTYIEKETRFELASHQNKAGVSSKGFSEDFALEGSRSLYGATKLCSEYIIQEYSEMYNVPAVINRCAVLTGPWQMGKVDQGVTALWVARHIFKGELSYFGYGGEGKQVRDILHIEDLFQLICKQIETLDGSRAEIYNVGGGNEVSISLLELTKICEEVTGNRIKISSVPENRVADIPFFITDNSRISKTIDWAPKIKPREIVADIADWIYKNKNYLNNLLN